MHARGLPVWSRSIAIVKHQESDRYQARASQETPDPGSQPHCSQPAGPAVLQTRMWTLGLEGGTASPSVGSLAALSLCVR